MTKTNSLAKFSPDFTMGGNTDNVFCDETGVFLNGTARKQKVIPIWASSITEGQSKPPVVVVNSNWVALDYSGGKDVSFTVIIPNDYAPGTDVIVNVYHAPKVSNTSSINWNAIYLCNNPTGALNLATVASTASSTNNQTWVIDRVYKSPNMVINGASFQRGWPLLLKIQMDNGSSYGDKTRVILFTVTYTINELA